MRGSAHFSMFSLQLLDWLGSATFAASGALVAGRKKFDFFGTLAVAFVTALGGGTLRDLLLGLTPVFWIQDPLPVVLVLVTAAITFVLMRYVTFPRRTLLVLDALGLGFFAVMGAERALGAGAPALIAVMMGMVSGTAGGVIRDVLCGEVPTIFWAEMYATAAIFGATVYILLPPMGCPKHIALFVGVAATFLLRLAALRWKMRLPEAKVHGGS